MRWRIEWMFDTSTPPLKEYTATDTNVFTVFEPGTFANPLTERSCELPGLCRRQRPAVCKWITQGPQSDAAAVRAVDGSYQAVGVDPVQVWRAGLLPLVKLALYAAPGLSPSQMECRTRFALARSP